MAFNKNDISSIIKEQIKKYENKAHYYETGKVITVGDGVALISGLEKAILGEIIEFESNVKGMVLNLEEDFVGVVILGNDQKVFEGQIVKRTNKIISVAVGQEIIGRVINALGEPIDGKGPINSAKTRNVFTNTPEIMKRQEVNQPLKTGILLIDSLIPIGKGQRELIIGDRQTGKTAIAIDTILNQKNQDVYCIYVAIGQKNSTIAQIVSKLEKEGALEYTTIVVASASELSPLQYISPYVGVTIAEEFMEQGKDVLIVYDDLSKHAVAYRTLSLLLRRPPGREAFPGDIFYQHSYLLERAAKLNEKNGGGSITALPIIETQSGDISAYIPTNVISITDGQIFMKESLFNSGQRPAVDVGFSVSRVGSSAQTKLMKSVVSSLKLELAQYNEMKAFAQFGSDLDESTKKILSHGSKVYEILKQDQYLHISEIDQVILLFTIQYQIVNPIPLNEIRAFNNELLQWINTENEMLKLKAEILKNKTLDSQTLSKLYKKLVDFANDFTSKIDDYNPNNHLKIPQLN
ncbi:F0F1 ATP synthase subunit alpha [Mesomycoplasma neurolyticum]|uniref:ATP synthase subunit alpha n=1 Tax=Mesomycoplasma neurolyticum TaxID=2120 RepID=A0A449A4S9_9BACT|nr:F0F1 ATP synthase subunit alpha [Mesomycoplasma neurolyticum]VEU59248.1 ATP synthase F0F1 subunit alpha [Mesomycoplasma neurolyticum]